MSVSSSNSPIVGMLAAVASLAPLAASYLYGLSTQPNARFAVLMIVPAALAIIWNHRELWRRPSNAPSETQAVATSAAVVLLVSAGLLGSPTLGYLSFVFVIPLASS